MPLLTFCFMQINTHSSLCLSLFHEISDLGLVPGAYEPCFSLQMSGVDFTHIPA